MKRPGWAGRMFSAVGGMFSRSAPAAEPETLSPDLLARLTFFHSRLNKERNASPEPVVLFGTTPFYGEVIAEKTTFHAIGVEKLADLEGLLAALPCIGIIAASPKDQPGLAGEGIRAFRASPSGGEFAIYQAVALDVEAGAKRALEYEADALFIRGMTVGSVLGSVVTILRRVKTGVARPASWEAHVALLRELAPDGGFWDLQGLPVSAFKEGMYVDPAKMY